MLEFQISDRSQPSRERRGHLRLDVLGQVEVRLITNPAPTAVRDLSPAGIALETTAALVVGTEHRLRIVGAMGLPVIEAPAVVIHRMQLAGASRLSVFLVGFRFGPLDDASQDGLMAILDDVHALAGAADSAVSPSPGR